MNDVSYMAKQKGLNIHNNVVPDSARKVSAVRRRRGAMAAQSGQLAEDQVAALYAESGHEIVARRWRGTAGEIDLICRDGDCLVFVEVKKALSHIIAGERLLRRQIERIGRSANEYCGGLPDGLLHEMRFDAALVDAVGCVKVVENAFAYDL